VCNHASDELAHRSHDIDHHDRAERYARSRSLIQRTATAKFHGERDNLVPTLATECPPLRPLLAE